MRTEILVIVPLQAAALLEDGVLMSSRDFLNLKRLARKLPKKEYAVLSSLNFLRIIRTDKDVK